MVLPERYELKDEQWERIEAFFPAHRTGRPPKLANRTVLNAILWLLHNGAPPVRRARKTSCVNA